ncbi:hypothetical protein BDN72DRAFT_904868 [Pluteus cervinus]|uniref:Uncharacterized protein n=1 Tax=Pluteus cervinus TaxID=181527 RepID=A0ACD3A3Y4_9AGAR|nr:hypothetical protein BDN72DRAFT_904868 [Pluteus cervinus]
MTGAFRGSLQTHNNNNDNPPLLSTGGFSSIFERGGGVFWGWKIMAASITPPSKNLSIPTSSPAMLGSCFRFQSETVPSHNNETKLRDRYLVFNSFSICSVLIDFSRLSKYDYNLLPIADRLRRVMTTPRKSQPPEFETTHEQHRLGVFCGFELI